MSTKTQSTEPSASSTPKPPAEYSKVDTKPQQTQTPQPPAQTQGSSKPAEPEPADDDIRGIVRQAVGEIVNDMKSEFQQGLDGLSQRLDSATAPQARPWAQSVGGRPNGPSVVRPGALGTGKYRYHRVMQAVSGQRNWNDFPVEGMVHNRLKDAYAQFLGLHGEDGILLPLSAKFIEDFDSDLACDIRELSLNGIEGLDMSEIKQAARARVQQADNNGRPATQIAQNLSIYDDTYLGAFISFAEAGDFISLLRPMEIFSQAGARQVQFLPNGTFPMISQTGQMTAYWVGKGRTDDDNRSITKSTPRTGAQKLVAKKLACLIDVPSEFSRFGAASTEAFIRADMAEVMSLELDASLYNGAGTAHEPNGVRNYLLDDLYQALEGDNGDLFRSEDLDLMVATIEERDVRMSNPAFVTRPMMAARIQTRRADAVSAQDMAGPFVAINMAFSGVLAGGGLRGYNVYKSTTIPNNLTDGSATNLTEIMCFQPSEMIIARMGVIEMSMTDSHSDNFAKDLKTLRAIQFVDGGPRRTEAFLLCTKLIQDDATFVATSS